MTTTTIYANYSGACPYCGDKYNRVFHPSICPKIKAKEFYPNGMLKRIEFHREYAASRYPGLHLGDIDTHDGFDDPMEIRG